MHMTRIGKLKPLVQRNGTIFLSINSGILT